MTFLAILRANFLTLKRTRALWLAIVAPLFIVFFRMILLLFTSDPSVKAYAWDSLFENNSFFWFGLLFLLTGALDCALLVDIDRGAHAWKYVFALPVARSSWYLAKFVVSIVLVLVSNIVLFIATLVVGYLLGVLSPQQGYTLGSPHVFYYIGVILLETVATLFLVAIYTWLSMRTKSFILPAALGIVGIVINLVGYNSPVAQRFVPSMYALDIGKILARTPQNEPYVGWSLLTVILVSCVGALCFTLLGIWDLNRREIY
jgi:hypothetical protein